MAQSVLTAGQTDMFQTKLLSVIQKEMNKLTQIEITKFQKEFGPKMKELVQQCQDDVDNMMTKYYTTRKEFALKMNANLDKYAARKLNELRGKLDKDLATIEKELFNNPKSLLKQITDERKKLEEQRKMLKEEMKTWGIKEKRIANYLGFGSNLNDINDDNDNKNDDNNPDDDDDEKKYGGLDDDDDNHGFSSNIQKYTASINTDNKTKPEDWITINVDGRIFGTYRSTLCQVKSSVLAIMFGVRSDMIHQDSNGIYYLDRNSEIFGQILEILRRRGVMPSTFELTPELQAELLELGLYKAFFKDVDISDESLLFGVKAPTKLLFQTYRSNSATGNYVVWNTKGIQNSAQSTKYWELNKKNGSEIIIHKTGWYRLVSRIIARINSGCYSTITINGSHKYYCHHYGYSSSYYKSFNFNELIQFKKNDKIQIFIERAPYSETISSYLCLETIPQSILTQSAVYNSSTATSHYRVWNKPIKACNNYTTSSYFIVFQKGGLYRVSSRVHSYYGSSGTRTIQLYIYKGNSSNTKQISNYQGYSSSSTIYSCHNFEEIIEMHPGDQISIYDGSYGSSNTDGYESINIQPIVSCGLVGSWHSHTCNSSNIRIWTHDNIPNPTLFEMKDSRTKIEIKQNGYYRIGCMLTNSNSNDGYVALYLNDSQYCISRMGVKSGSYYHTNTIQEILKLKKGDKMHIYCSSPYNNWKSNTLFVEKLIA